MDFHDLLQNDFKRFHAPDIEFNKNSNILITGAGGSIGSEICRQVINGNPKNLYILDSSEFALFNIFNDLNNISSKKNISTNVHPLLVNLCDKNLLELSIGEIHFDYIFHAAAYKHVNMLQLNPISAFSNNVIGTYNLLNVSKNSSDNLILISTDKAVNPVNIMGQSKQFCEMVVQNFSDLSCGCNYNIVRFGNVLHSSGSVIPIFQNQISKKLPVTVTDKDATRYFMTIPEAVSLVISASSIQSNGFIYVLDMGEPVKILDLAIHMIKLSGNTPTYGDPVNNEIKIEFIGIRDGEKIDEQLTNGDLENTNLEGIFRAIESHDSDIDTIKLIQKIKNINNRGDLEYILSALNYG